MYNSDNINKRIKELCKIHNINQKDLLNKCGLNKDALNTMTDKKGISCFSLCKIAEVLNVSVDYLLGRTENPEVNK